jgi:hypothetical protein
VPHDITTRARAVLAALADLAPAGEEPETTASIPLDWFRWLPASAAGLFRPPAAEPQTLPAGVDVDRAFAERLAAVDQVRAGHRSLRVGWLFVAGRTGTGNGARRVLHPLVTIPVRAQRGAPFGGRPRLVAAGDPELSPLIPYGAERARLEEAIEYGGGGLDGVTTVEIPSALLARLARLQHFANAAAAAAGFAAARGLVTAGEAPETYLGRPGLVVVAGAAVYAVEHAAQSSRAGSLRAWAERVGDEPTAFHTTYLGVAPYPPHPTETPESPFLLSAAQRRAVAASRTEPLGVVSGAPGTGKSQTVVAIACDALARGETVLLAARSDATVDALLDLLERTPGPRPVVFGSSERRLALATRLADGIDPAPRQAVADAHRVVLAAAARRDALRASLAGTVRVRALAAGDPALAALRDATPGLFAPATDLARADRLLRRVASGGGWLARRRAGRAARGLRTLAGAAPGTAVADLAAALDLARAVGAAAGRTGSPAPPTADTVGGGTLPQSDYAALAKAEDAVRDAAARWLALLAVSEARFDPASRRSVQALATALRSGRAARRAQLAGLDRRLTKALPLWVGSLPDIDDLLPPVAGLFDVVVLDEASSIDQPLAAPALLRARRAVVVGDPKQLRHVSFLADTSLASVLSAQGLADDPLLSAALDVRRNSAFDVAAGAASVVTLDEHFRSRPHLVEFVARRLYGGAFAVAGRSPRTECIDCIDVDRIAGRRGKAGVVVAETDHVLDLLRHRRDGRRRSVGVITPFRPQADALERAVLAAFTADELESMDLRVGTVHAFQGNERDDVLVCLGVDPDAARNTWRFVEDPHLFAVLTTRAREHVTVVHSAVPKTGLVADYLAQADSPPGRPPDAPVSSWAATLADGLREAGVDVVTGYPAGRHTVDVCVYASTPFAVVTDPHPDGPDAHVDRAVSLVRNGWRVLDALPRPLRATASQVVLEVLAALREDG